MSPLSASLLALLASAGAASAKQFSQVESYDISNFFNKFDFFQACLISSSRCCDTVI